MVKTDVTEIELPFSGFYESEHDTRIDWALEIHFEDDECNLSDADTSAIYSADVDWQAIRTEYCQAYIEALNAELCLDLEYTEMTSPRFYNYSSDRLFCNIPSDKLAKIRTEVEAYPEYAQTIRDQFTSYDGFWSNYDSNIEHQDWTRSKLDQCQYMVIFKLWLDHNGNSDIEYNLDINVYEFESIGKAIDVINDYRSKKQ